MNEQQKNVSLFSTRIYSSLFIPTAAAAAFALQTAFFCGKRAKNNINYSPSTPKNTNMSRIFVCSLTLRCLFCMCILHYQLNSHCVNCNKPDKKKV